MYLVTAVAGYALFLTAVFLWDARIEAEMLKYDLDGDGSIDVRSPAAEAAAEEWASDTSRLFAPFIGLPLTFIWYFIVLGVCFGGEWTIRRLFFSGTRHSVSELQRAESEKPLVVVEDGNPFRSSNVQ